MNTNWEDEQFLYEDEKDGLYWGNIFGGFIILTILFFSVYGIVSFIKDIF